MEELIVRVGTVEDMDSIMSLALAACDENGFLNPNPLKLAKEIYPALAQASGLVGIISPKGEKPEGAILLRIGEMWYADQPVVEERAIFIDPKFRQAKGGRAKKLCEFGKSVADKLNMPLIIGVLSNHRTEAKVRMYKRIFGEPAGAFFLYNARTGLAVKEAAE